MWSLTEIIADCPLISALAVSFWHSYDCSSGWSPLGTEASRTPVSQNLPGEQPIETLQLDDIPSIGDIDFIKIDVQGAELMIFENASKALANAVAIQTEVGFVAHYIDQPLFAEVDIELRRNGFQFHTFQGFGSRAFKPLAKSRDCNEGFRQIIWSDAVYVKDWMHFERQSNDKLKKYPVLMHDIFGSYDLSHAVIDELDRRQSSRLGERYRERLIGPA
jgi:hypothetical protein